MRRVVLTAGIAVAALGVLTGCATSSERGSATYVGPSIPSPTATASPTAPPKEQAATVAVPYLPSNYNPYSASGSGTQTLDITSVLLPSTFVQQPSGEFELNSDLLEKASVKTDHGKQVVEYQIADDAKWSDGTPITADDFTYLWKQVNQQHSTILGGYDQISDVSQKGSDSKDVKVTFSQPFAEWQSLFDPLLPAHFLRDKGWDDGFARGVPVSAGPFTVQSAASSRLVLQRNEDYFGDLAGLEKLVVQPLPDSAAMSAAVRSGEADLGRLSADDAQPPHSVPNADQVPATAPMFDQLTANTASGPAKTAAVRKAVAYGLDRAALLSATSTVDSKAVAAGNRMLIPGTPGYQDNSLSYDPNRAKQALLSAGYRPNSSGSMAKGGKPLQLRLVTLQSDSHDVHVAELVSAQLRRIGVQVLVSQLPANVLFDAALPHGDFDLALLGYQTTSQPAVDALASYGCSGAGNYSHLCDHATDELMKQAVSAKDPGRAATLLNQADRRLWDSVPTIPLIQDSYQIVQAQDLTGVQYNSAADSLLWNAASWKVK
ncbi:MAG TPA: ABC transporter family substrate-binding protein [Mycobacteriales bacterium]|nr:ABC transporter family substrate-binding protein [Mycobacteriales bacterium]